MCCIGVDNSQCLYEHGALYIWTKIVFIFINRYCLKTSNITVL